MSKTEIPVTDRLLIRDKAGSMPDIHLVGGMDPYSLSGIIGAERQMGYPEQTVQLAVARREQNVALWQAPAGLAVTWGTSAPGLFGKAGMISDADVLVQTLSRLNQSSNRWANYDWAGPTSGSIAAGYMDRSMVCYNGPWTLHRNLLYQAIGNRWLELVRGWFPSARVEMILQPSVYANPGGGPMPGLVAKALLEREPTPGYTPIRLLCARYLKNVGCTVLTGIYAEFKSGLAPWIKGIDNLHVGAHVGDWGAYAQYAPSTFDASHIVGYDGTDFFSDGVTNAKRRGVRMAVHDDFVDLVNHGVMGTAATMISYGYEEPLHSAAARVRMVPSGTYDPSVSVTAETASVAFAIPSRFGPLYTIEDPFDLGEAGYDRVTVGQAPVGPQFMDEIVLFGTVTEAQQGPGDALISVAPTQRVHLYKGNVAVAMADGLAVDEAADLNASSVAVMTWTSTQHVHPDPISQTGVYARAAEIGDDGIRHLLESVLIPARDDLPVVTVGDANTRAAGKAFNAAAYVASFPGTGSRTYRVEGSPGANVFLGRDIDGGAWLTVDDFEVLSGYLVGDIVEIASGAITSGVATDEQIAMFFSELAGEAVRPGQKQATDQGEFSETDVVAGEYERAAWSVGRKCALDVSQFAVNRRPLVDVVAASYAFGKAAARKYTVTVSQQEG